MYFPSAHQRAYLAEAGILAGGMTRMGLMRLGVVILERSLMTVPTLAAFHAPEKQRSQPAEKPSLRGPCGRRRRRGRAGGSLCAGGCGFRVTVLERRGYLGGRASSYLHPGTGEVIDNCQHVLFGCCTNLKVSTSASAWRTRSSGTAG
jgi:hypothetical protein